MLPNYPAKWGFITKPEDMLGKTVTDVSVAKMPYGCTWDSCLLFRFSDGTRGFLYGTSSRAVGPDAEIYAQSRFFTPEEYGEVAAEIKRQGIQRDMEIRKDKERQLARLQQELSNGGH